VRKHIGAKPAPVVPGNGLRDEHSGEPLDRSLITNSKRRQADRGDLTAANKKTKRISAARRDEPVTCAACGRKVQRRMRGQRYCSARCRENDRGRVRKAFLAHDTRAPTTPVKKCSSINDLQPARTGSSTATRVPAALRGRSCDINDLMWDRMTLRQRRGGRVMATIVPDEAWPAMWRVRMPDGHLIDMVNLTRAKDAAVAASRAVNRPGKTGDNSAPENTTQAISTAEPAAPLRIVIEPTASGRKWTARLGGRVLCVSAWPFVKSARLLLAEGYPADTVVEVWRPNAAEWAMRGNLGAVAATLIDGEAGSRGGSGK
jgi:hypothetical protein